MSYNIVIEVPPEVIANLMVTRFEDRGYFVIKNIEVLVGADYKWYEKEFYENYFEIEVEHEDLDDEENFVKTVITPETVQESLKFMNETYPHLMKDIAINNIDITIADAFIQCCVYKDIIFG